MTKLEIFNIALLSAGTDPIPMESDKSRNGIMCRSFYTLAAKTILDEYDWPSAVKRAELSPIEETDPRYNADLFLREYQYEIPEDCIAVRSIGGDVTVPRLVEGGYLYCDEDEIVLDYIADISEPETEGGELLFPPLVCDSIARYMAYRMAPKISPKMNVSQLWQEYLVTLQKAKDAAGRERRESNQDEDGEWL